MLYLIVELRWLLLAAAGIGLVTGFVARRAGNTARKGATRLAATREGGLR